MQIIRILKLFKNNRYVYYIDLDGVLADFNSVPNAVKLFRHTPKFFLKLKPILKNVAAVNELIESGAEVYILSSSPNKRCDTDKILWCKIYLPKLPISHIIIIRLGENKADHMVSENGILFDDYGKNCRQWVEKTGNIACKITHKHGIKSYIRYISKYKQGGAHPLIQLGEKRPKEKAMKLMAKAKSASLKADTRINLEAGKIPGFTAPQNQAVRFAMKAIELKVWPKDAQAQEEAKKFLNKNSYYRNFLCDELVKCQDKVINKVLKALEEGMMSKDSDVGPALSKRFFENNGYYFVAIDTTVFQDHGGTAAVAYFRPYRIKSGRKNTIYVDITNVKHKVICTLYCKKTADGKIIRSGIVD